MKVEFEFTLDSVGSPYIKFRHHDRDDSLEQKLLKVFLDGASKNGITLAYQSGYLECGTKNSWSNYEIKIAR